ncbi:DUF1810 domain-containing protein [Neorhizobium galegae]|uniref:DUF1810 domain-containing protein n=1 Tax=Neorhizobium galegae TaxID=399 RepID=UPI001AE282BC|nr:DUF1810 domain-containing protein [Neorhizobium galegae]
MADEKSLRRFIEAQAPVYAEALEELRHGAKRSHWMWFIFPQIAGLGHSPTARFYAIADRKEAQAYLAHPLLGSRLIECTQAMLMHSDKTANAILGSPDDLKFRSSMTLFDAVSEAETEKGSPFGQALLTFYDGRPDEATLTRL